MSTDDEPPPRPSVTRFYSARLEDTKATRALTESQEEIVGEKDGRKEERFLWICACVVLFDCAIFMNAENFGGTLIVGVIQLLALIILARRLGVEEVRELVYGLIDRLGRANNGG